jgi:Raf kinase inhibitor-like YbhB/YbcL family protein
MIEQLIISSTAFKPEGVIPNKYACDGLEVSPPLKIDNIPFGTATLAIIVEDPDAPNGTFDHWVVWNIPSTNSLEEGTKQGVHGKNSAGMNDYHGPCPPSGYHRYYFNVFALDCSLDLPDSTDKQALQAAMDGHVLASGFLMGRYQRVLVSSKA